MNYGSILEKISRSAFESLEAIPDAVFAEKANGKWSKKEILGHLIDSAYNNHRRLILALEQDHLIFDGYNQDQWVSTNNYHEQEKEDIVILWKMCNLHMAQLLETYPNAVMEKEHTKHSFHQTAMYAIPENEIAKLSYLVWDYLVHLEHHLAQIIPNYTKCIGEYNP